MSLTELSMDQLMSRRRGLLIEINVEKLKAKNSLLKTKSLKLQEAEYALARVDAEIARRTNSRVQQGLQMSASKSSFSPPQAFQSSSSSVFQPSVGTQQAVVPPAPSAVVPPSFSPPAPSPVERPKLPSGVTTFPIPKPKPMPSFSKEVFDKEVKESDTSQYEIPSKQRTDYFMWIEENKMLLGVGALVGLYLVFGRKKPKKSNPKRKRKSKKRRSNNKRRGYNRH